MLIECKVVICVVVVSFGGLMLLGQHLTSHCNTAALSSIQDMRKKE